MTIPLVPTEVTTEWLRSVLGEDVEQVEWLGNEHGMSGHVAKVSTGTAPMALKLSPAAKAQRELIFYRHFAPDTPVSLPRFHSGGVDERAGWVLLDYIEATRQGDVLEGATPDQAAALAASLSSLHGRWWGSKESAPAEFLSEPSPWEVPPQAAPAAAVELCAGLLPGPMTDHFIASVEDPAGWHRRLMGGDLTLISTDFHLDNVLWDAHDRPWLLDWEGTTFGPAEIDVARLLYECMTPDQYPTGGPRALDTYRRNLLAEWGHQISLTRVVASVAVSLTAIAKWVDREASEESRSRRLSVQALRGATAVFADLAGEL